MADRSSWPDRPEPVVGFMEETVLDVEGVAQMEELQALFLKRIEQLRAEGIDTPETRLHWLGIVQPDFSGMSDEKSESIETQIEEMRADPAFRARKRRLEEGDPELDQLMDEDGEP